MVHQALLPKDLFPVLFLPWRKGWGVRSGFLLICFIRLSIFNLPAWAEPPTGLGEVIPSGPGKVVAAGPGKTVPAGPGKVVVADEKGHWRTFRKEHGLVTNEVTRIFQDREGYLWFGTVRGVSRYDGQGFVNFTTQDGLANNTVVAICQDREGALWFGTYGGASRYDPPTSGSALRSGQAWTTFTIEDGLAGNNVQAIILDRGGSLWFGARDGGVSRYDGKTFTNFTTKNGLALDRVWSALQDPEGNLWFGTDGGGVSRYDGKAFKTFTSKDGLASNIVYSTFQDREGNLWFSTLYGGVSRYDGKTFKTFTTQDGLADNGVSTICQDREGVFWFGTKFKAQAGMIPGSSLPRQSSGQARQALRHRSGEEQGSSPMLRQKTDWWTTRWRRFFKTGMGISGLPLREARASMIPEPSSPSPARMGRHIMC